MFLTTVIDAGVLSASKAGRLTSRSLDESVTDPLTKRRLFSFAGNLIPVIHSVKSSIRVY
jgi:hypothetical protein